MTFRTPSVVAPAKLAQALDYGDRRFPANYAGSGSFADR
jgi:hypothetical protein